MGATIIDLMRLKIPTGWRVAANSFFDVDPPNEGDARGALFPFVQDIASLEYEAREGDTGRREVYVVDLGWVPDQDPAGQYRLVLLCGGWDDVVCVYEDRDRFRVRDRLEAWLDCVARAPDRSQLARLMRKSERKPGPRSSSADSR